MSNTTDKDRTVSTPRTALITGASGEIGGAIAEACAAAGFKLYLCAGRGRSAAEALAHRLGEQHGVLCIPLAFDITDEMAVEAALAGIPSLDAVISCAGIAHFDLLQETTAADWNRVINTNLTGTFYVLRRAIPLLLKSEIPRILNITSVWGSHGASCEAAYSASKGGMDALTRSLALELAPNHIPVNAIACGVIDTGMNRRHLSGDELEALKDEIPAGRFGTPEEVAAFALALINAPDYLTGQIIQFSGGWKT